MNIKIYKNIFSVFIITVFSLLLCGCCSDEDGKIPITSSSCEARDYYIQGRELAENLQKQEALQFFNKALEIDSGFAKAYLGAAIVQSEPNKMIDYMKLAMSNSDGVSEGELLQLKAVQAGFNRRFEDQLKYYSKLQEKYPGDERVFYELGNIYFSQHQYDKAIENFKKSINIDETFAPVYNQIGYAFRNIGKFDLAEKAFKRYIRLIPNHPNPYDSYAELLLKMGEYEASLEQYRKAIKYDSNFVASYIGMASNLVYISDYYEARLLMERFYNKARNEEEKRRAKIFTAITYVDENDYQNAIAVLNELAEDALKLKNTITYSRATGVLSAIFFESHKYNKAIDLYNKAINSIKNSNLPEELKTNVRLDGLFGEALVSSKQKKYQYALERATDYMTKAQKSNDLYKIKAGHELFGRIALDMKEYSKAVENLKKSDLHNPYNMFLLALAYKNQSDIENAKLYLEKVVEFNSLLDLNYAFCRSKAKNLLVDLQYNF